MTYIFAAVINYIAKFDKLQLIYKLLIIQNEKKPIPIYIVP